MSWVPTPTSHLHPTAIQTVEGHSFPSATVCHLNVRGTIPSVAATRIAVAASDVEPLSNKFSTTLTFTGPEIFFLSALVMPNLVEPENSRSSEDTPGHVLPVERNTKSVEDNFSHNANQSCVVVSTAVGRHIPCRAPILPKPTA